jgi:hypothetical protein
MWWGNKILVDINREGMCTGGFSVVNGEGVKRDHENGIDCAQVIGISP